jgi:hypothetical protein
MWSETSSDGGEDEEAPRATKAANQKESTQSVPLNVASAVVSSAATPVERKKSWADIAM